MKIAAKISLSFFIIAVILTTIASSIFYFIVKESLETAIDARMNSAAYSRAQHIKTYLQMLKSSIGQLSKSIVLENFLRDKKNKDAFDIATQRLVRTKEANPSISDFLLLDTSGKIIASSNEKYIGMDKSTDVYFIAGQKKSFIKDAYYSEGRKEGVLVTSYPFSDSKTGELLGVLAAEIKLDELYRITVDRTGLGETGEIIIANKYGFLITPSRFLKDTFLKQRVDTENFRICMLQRDPKYNPNTEQQVLICPDYRGVMIMGSHAYLPEMEWAVLGEMSLSEAMAPLKILYYIYVTILIMAPFLAWLAGRYLSDVIAGPIRKLQEGIRIIGTGDLNHRIGIDAKDEIGQLAAAFDNMAKDLKYTTTSIDRLNKESAERAKAENSIRRLADIVESSDDAIIGKDLDNKITNWNKGAHRFYGYTEKEAVGKHISIVVPAEFQHELDIIMQKIKKGQPIEHFETMRLRKDGTIIPVSLTISPIKDKDGNITGASTVAHDITEHKKMEELLKKYNEELEREIEERTLELKEAQDKLVRSEKLAIVGKLASSVAHELRNPLGVMKNVIYYLNMLKTEKENPEVKENLDVIAQEIENSDRIITDLLEFSRAKKPTLHPENINLIVKEVLNRIRINPDIKVDLELEENLPDIEIDALQMHQVFYNITKNAIEAMEKGGRLKIKTRISDNFIVVAFSDTGSGINKENLNKIFEPLFSTKAKGTGLGLSVCSSLVEGHSGKIEVASEVDKGTTFTIKLPVKRG